MTNPQNIFREMEASMNQHPFLAANPVLKLIENNKINIGRAAQEFKQGFELALQ